MTRTAPHRAAVRAPARVRGRILRWLGAVPPEECANCAHTWERHQHYRRGTECSPRDCGCQAFV